MALHLTNDGRLNRPAAQAQDVKLIFQSSIHFFPLEHSSSHRWRPADPLVRRKAGERFLARVSGVLFGGCNFLSCFLVSCVAALSSGFGLSSGTYGVARWGNIITVSV